MLHCCWRCVLAEAIEQVDGESAEDGRSALTGSPDI